MNIIGRLLALPRRARLHAMIFGTVVPTVTLLLYIVEFVIIVKEDSDDGGASATTQTAALETGATTTGDTQSKNASAEGEQYPLTTVFLSAGERKYVPDCDFHVRLTREMISHTARKYDLQLSFESEREGMLKNILLNTHGKVAFPIHSGSKHYSITPVSFSVSAGTAEFTISEIETQ